MQPPPASMSTTITPQDHPPTTLIAPPHGRVTLGFRNVFNARGAESKRVFRLGGEGERTHTYQLYDATVNGVGEGQGPATNDGDAYHTLHADTHPSR